MRESKKVVALLTIVMGVLFLILSFIQKFSEPFMIAAGSAIIAYGLGNYLFEHFVHKIGRMKIMDEDERNIIITGKANTIVSEFANVEFIILALYSYIYKHDLIGCIIAAAIFMINNIIYAISFKIFDKI